MGLFRRRRRTRDAAPDAQATAGGTSTDAGPSPSRRQRRRDRRAAKRRAHKSVKAEAAGPSRSSQLIRRVLTTSVFWRYAGVVVVFFVAFGTAPMAFDVSSGTGIAIGPFLALAIAGPLALTRGQPLLAWVTGTAAAVVIPLLLTPTWITPWPWPVIHGLVLFVLLFAVTAAERLWVGVTAVAVSAIVWGFGVQEGRAPWVFAVVVVGLSGVLTGRLARSRRALRRERELTLAEQSSRVVLQERARIARDLHDIVAHHMSLVVVQAETARYRIPDVPESVLAELDSISSSAREALTETRALLSVLRGSDDETVHAPQPGLAQIGDLVDGARRAGMELTESVDCPRTACGRARSWLCTGSSRSRWPMPRGTHPALRCV